MSASQFEPEELNIIDIGNAPEILVDGIAGQVEVNGIVRIAFFTLQTGHDERSQPNRVMRIVSLRLNCSAEVYRQIQRQTLTTSPVAQPRAASH